MTLMEIFVNTEPYGAGNFKALLLLQFLFDVSLNFMRELVAMVEDRLLLFLAIRQV